MCRFEFMEILVRIAETKFKRTQKAKNFSEALEKLLTEHCFANYEYPPWHDWRVKNLWTLEVDMVLKANLDNLK